MCRILQILHIQQCACNDMNVVCNPMFTSLPTSYPNERVGSRYAVLAGIQKHHQRHHDGEDLARSDKRHGKLLVLYNYNHVILILFRNNYNNIKLYHQKSSKL